MSYAQRLMALLRPCAQTAAHRHTHSETSAEISHILKNLLLSIEKKPPYRM